MMRHLVILLVCGVTVSAEKPSRFAKWEKAIQQFEKQDKASPPPKNAILFVGSSSIRLWNLKKSFPDRLTINRGFGGSTIADSIHFAPRIILKHEPRVIVLYAGDNDIARGLSPKQVSDDFRTLANLIHKKLPKTKLAFIAIKPSGKRWKLANKIRQANKLIQEQCKAQSHLSYVDIFKPMLGDDGKPRGELFVKDQLHLNAKGYQLWAKILLPHLK